VVDIGSGVGVWMGGRRWDWSTLGTTYYRWFTHYGRYPSKAKELATEVVAGTDDPRERAKRIHDWIKSNLTIQAGVARLTGVPRSFEISTVDVEELIKEKQATPEAAASLMWLMFQAAGIEATLVLATDENNPAAEEGMPTTGQFNYPLLALDDRTLIDTTDRLCPFGMVPWKFEGRKALWIKGGSVAFKDVPVSRAADNRKEVRVSGTVEPNGDVKVETHFTLTGQLAYAFRRIYAPLKPKEREDGARAYAVFTSDKAEMDEFIWKNIDEPDKPLELLLHYHVPGHAEVMQDKMVFRLGAFVDHTVCPSWWDYHKGGRYYACPMPTAEKRQNALKFPFKRYDEINVDVKFPMGFLLQALPKGFRTRNIEKGTAVGLQTSYGSDGGKSLQILRKFSVNEPFVDKKGYQALQKMIRRYKAQKDILVTLEIPKLTD
jgi:hypothetical protein